MPKPQYMQKALELGIVDEIHKTVANSVTNSDLIVLATPVGAYGKIIKEIAPHLKKAQSSLMSAQSKPMP